MNALIRWLATNLLLPDSRAKAVSDACLYMHLSPRVKALVIILVSTGAAAILDHIRLASGGWSMRVAGLGLAISASIYCLVQVPLLVVMHTHNRRIWACWDLDNLLAKMLSGYQESSHWLRPQQLSDDFLERMVADINQSQGPLYVLSQNGIYMYAEEVRQVVSTLLPNSEAAQRARKSLDVLAKHSSQIRIAIINHPGVVYFMLPDYREPAVRAVCRHRRKLLGIESELDRAVGREGMRVLRKLVWTRRRAGRRVRVVRIPHVCSARALLVGNRCYVQPFPEGRHGIAEPVGVVDSGNERAYAVLRSVIVGLSHEG